MTTMLEGGVACVFRVLLLYFTYRSFSFSTSMWQSVQ